MKKTLLRIVSLMICVTLTAAVLSVAPGVSAAADQTSQLQNDIAVLKQQQKEINAELSKLKSQKASQDKILAALRQKIANTQAQISRCNKEITSITGRINENKAEIDARNRDIEDTKLSFKKRLRSIYMSNTNSSVQVLMGADSFANLLQLAQLTAAVSAHDRAIIEDLVEAIDALNVKKAENEALLNQQVEVKNSIVAAQRELQAEEDEAESIANGIAADQKSTEADKAAVESDIKEKQAALSRILGGGSAYGFINTKSGFMWPVPGYVNISSHYGPRWGTMHRGMDISGGNIFGKPIVAITDGVVYEVYSGCPHTSKASRCRCGSGWGNHVAINHGTIGGVEYKAMYAHMNTIAASVGQHVTQGQVIGYVGTTGDSTGYHLHFGLMRNGGWVNPYPYFFS